MHFLMKKYSVIIACSLLFGSSGIFAQEKGVMIDEVVAIVGKEYILHSEIESQYLQMKAQTATDKPADMLKCTIVENMLFQKLLVNQADIDSVVVSESQVESEMDRRLRYYVAQFGSQEKLEEFYQKSIIEIKEEFRGLVRDQMLADEVQRGITKNVTITPTEVKNFFRDIPSDSIPEINSAVEIAQIVRTPSVTEEEKKLLKDRLNDYRTRILKGEIEFKTLAYMYSEDPESAKNNGEIGLTGRGMLYPEFEAVAFDLRPGQVSEVVETKAGFHILQLIERKGDYVNVRHILLRPKVSMLNLIKAKKELDSIAGLIVSKTITFDEAVKKFSDDPSKNNLGLLVNPMTGNSIFELDQLDPKVFFVIDKLEPGETSVPVQYTNENGMEAYRILMLKKRTEPHKANLKDDYNQVQSWALEFKKSTAVADWIKDKTKDTYIKINDSYKDCPFQNRWLAR